MCSFIHEVTPRAGAYKTNNSRKPARLTILVHTLLSNPGRRRRGGSRWCRRFHCPVHRRRRRQREPAALACDVDVVEGAPVAVLVGARKDGLAVRETVCRCFLVMTQGSPKIPSGVPTTVVGSVDHHGLSVHR